MIRRVDTKAKAFDQASLDTILKWLLNHKFTIFTLFLYSIL